MNELCCSCGRSKYEGWPMGGFAPAAPIPKTLVLPGVGLQILQGKPGQMEDRALACTIPGVYDGDCDFFAVYDGHAGEAAAQFCSTKLHGWVALFLASCSGDCEAALVAAFEEINERFLHESGEDTSGSTVCVVLRKEGVLYVANAGDSRCVLFGSGGPTQLTVEHSPDNPIEKARIEEEGGELFDPKDGSGSRVCGPNGCMLQVARSIGDRHFKPIVTSHPDTLKRPIVAEDAFLILASDGVWNGIANLAACSLVRDSLDSSGSPQDAAEALCKAAQQGGSEDNISAIVVVLNGNGHVSA